jgi:hypothetical protein
MGASVVHMSNKSCRFGAASDFFLNGALLNTLNVRWILRMSRECVKAMIGGDRSEAVAVPQNLQNRKADGDSRPAFLSI